MSSADQVGLALVEETTFGDVPSGPPTLQQLRFTSEDLRQDTNTVRSAEIRTDRQTPDIIRVGLSNAGSINFELSYAAYDALFEAALLSSDWSAAVTDISGATTISAAASDNSFNDSGNGFGNYDAGQWIKVSGFTTEANNGYFKIVTAAAGKLTVNRDVLVDEVAGDSVTITQAGYITNGTEQRTFQIERSHGDVGSTFNAFGGMAPDTLSMAVSTENIITGSFGFVGKRQTPGSATIGDGSNTAAPTNTIMNSVDNVALFLMDDASFGLTSFSFNLANNIQALLEVATLGATAVSAGNVAVSGTFQAYFEDNTVVTKYTNFSEVSFAMVLEDAAGNAYVLDLPAARLTANPTVASGQNQQVINDVSFEAKRDTSDGITIKLSRFAAA